MTYKEQIRDGLQELLMLVASSRQHEIDPELRDQICNKIIALRAAPPHPAPDALREAWGALARLRVMTPSDFKAYHSCVDLFEKALRAFSAPVQSGGGNDDC